MTIYMYIFEYLDRFEIPQKKELFFSHAQRSRIVDYILRRKRYVSETEDDAYHFGITRLLSKKVYLAAYPLHEGSWKPWTKPSMRKLLYEHWAYWKNFYKEQPLDYVRMYFGEKIALYFAWLGFYTFMLIPASVVGIFVFVYGVATVTDSEIALVLSLLYDIQTINFHKCTFHSYFYIYLIYSYSQDYSYNDIF